MSRYIMIRRLRGPVFLLLVGVLALLNQANILSWSKSWPLFLILAGVLLLAERAALAAGGGYPQGSYSCSNPASAPGAAPSAPSAETGIPAYPGQPEAFVPAQPHDLVKDDEGDQS